MVMVGICNEPWEIIMDIFQDWDHEWFMNMSMSMSCDIVMEGD